MPETYYTADSDVEAVRADFSGLITSLGDSAPDFHAQAAVVIDRDIQLAWYRSECDRRDLNPRATVYDRALLLTPNQYLGFAVAKVLELLYLYLSKDGDGDAAKLADAFAKRYVAELARAAEFGFDYSFDEDETITDDERQLSVGIRLVRV